MLILPFNFTIIRLAQVFIVVLLNILIVFLAAFSNITRKLEKWGWITVVQCFYLFRRSSFNVEDVTCSSTFYVCKQIRLVWSFNFTCLAVLSHDIRIF